MIALTFALAAVLIWGGFIYFTLRWLRLGALQGREGEIYFEMQSAAWSDRHIETLLARYPDSPTLLAQHAGNAAERKDWPEALRRSEVAIARAAWSPHAWLTRVNVLRRAGHAEEAAVLLRKAARKFPRDTEVLAIWANEAVGRKDWAEAARRFERLCRLEPDRARGYEWAANAYAEAGRPDAAEAVLDAGMQLLPEVQTLWQEAAKLAERCGAHDEAVRRWQALCRQFPDEPAGYASLAEALARAGRSDEAVALIRQSCDLFPDDAAIARVAAQLAPPEAAPPASPQAEGQ